MPSEPTVKRSTSPLLSFTKEKLEQFFFYSCCVFTERRVINTTKTMLSSYYV